MLVMPSYKDHCRRAIIALAAGILIWFALMVFIGKACAASSICFGVKV